MSMTIDWELFFPDVVFDISEDRMSSQMSSSGYEKSEWIYYWDPSIDFKSYLESIKVPEKYFNENDLTVFPKNFHKPIYSVKRFEEARVELLERLQFQNGEGLIGYDDEGNDILSYRMSLKFVSENVDVRPGTIGNDENKFRVSGNKNIISVHRFNMINILFDWLLTVNPKGAYKNQWKIFAYGITEYNETMSFISSFREEDSAGKLFGDNPVMTIETMTVFNDDSPVVGETQSASDIKAILKEWNPELI